MSDIRAQLEMLRVDWTTCQAHDDKKNSLVTGLFELIEKLSRQVSKAGTDARDKTELLELTRDRLDKAEKKIEGLNHANARHAFASVVIDGDCTPFKDELVQQGLEGGKRTASLLKHAIEEDLKSSVPDAAHHLQVVVRVYANVRGLASAYMKAKILPDQTVLHEFIRGFNMADAMFDFVDAGNGKECTDEKVKAVFKQSLADVHCRQMLFGGAADAGYARPLEPCVQDESTREKITLLEGPPFAMEMADIKSKFRTTSMNGVLRSNKLPSVKRKVSFRITPPPTPIVDYAAAAKTSSTPTAATSTKPVLTAPKGPASSLVLRNKLGQRVDPVLHYRNEDFLSLRAQKLCNSFHILGRCPYLTSLGRCHHDHGPKLNSGQIEALRAVARHSPCPFRLGCSDTDCLAGHRCVYQGCTGANCKFPPEMHNVDIKVVA